MFTCCKNTFPNFNITHSHFQAFIHSFLVRWLDVSAKRKQKWKSKGKKKRSSDLCTRGSKGGSGFQKQEEKKKCRRLFYIVRAENLGWGTRERATAGGYVCILNPEREKVTSSHHNFLLLLFVNRPHQSPLCPPPTSHTGAPARRLLRAAERWW